MTRALLTGATALALAPLPTAVFAVTAEEVWTRWQEGLDQAGYSVSSAGEAQSGGQLTISSLAIAGAFEGDGTITLSLEELAFVETGDGTVEVRMPPTIPLTITSVSEIGAAVEVIGAMTLTGLAMFVEDAEGGGTLTSYAAPGLGFTIDRITEGGEPLDIRADMTVSGLAGDFREPEDLTETTETSYAAEGLTFSMTGTDDESGGTFDFALTMAEIAAQSTGSYSSFMTGSEDLRTLLDRGLAVEALGTAGPITYTLSAEGLPESLDSSGSMTGAEARVVLNPETLDYRIAYNGLDFTASGDGIPLPQISGTLGQLGLNIAAPTNQESGPMALGVALRDLTVGEEIWALVDPAGAIPRDPATLIVDLAGQVRPMMDFFSAEEMAEPPTEMPAEVEQLTLQELRLAIGGAELTGEGAVDLDWSTDGPFGPGSPVADGAVTLTLTGGEGLLDTLVQMGLVPEQQAMLGRMMLGALALPGEEPDELVSEITIEPSGEILANGNALPF